MNNFQLLLSAFYLFIQILLFDTISDKFNKIIIFKIDYSKCLFFEVFSILQNFYIVLSTFRLNLIFIGSESYSQHTTGQSYQNVKQYWFPIYSFYFMSTYLCQPWDGFHKILQLIFHIFNLHNLTGFFGRPFGSSFGKAFW